MFYYVVVGGYSDVAKSLFAAGKTKSVFFELLNCKDLYYVR